MGHVVEARPSALKAQNHAGPNDAEHARTHAHTHTRTHTRTRTHTYAHTLRRTVSASSVATAPSSGSDGGTSSLSTNGDRRVTSIRTATCEGMRRVRRRVLSCSKHSSVPRPLARLSRTIECGARKRRRAVPQGPWGALYRRGRYVRERKRRVVLVNQTTQRMPEDVLLHGAAYPPLLPTQRTPTSRAAAPIARASMQTAAASESPIDLSTALSSDGPVAVAAHHAYGIPPRGRGIGR